MPASDSNRPNEPATHDAAAGAWQREQKASQQPAVRQHNPREQGINPDQRGPAQPNGQAD